MSDLHRDVSGVVFHSNMRSSLAQAKTTVRVSPITDATQTLIDVTQHVWTCELGEVGNHDDVCAHSFQSSSRNNTTVISLITVFDHGTFCNMVAERIGCFR